MPASIERGSVLLAAVLRTQACERSWRVIVSIALRPLWTASMRALTSPLWRIVVSTRPKPASVTTMPIVIDDEDLGERHAALVAQAGEHQNEAQVVVPDQPDEMSRSTRCGVLVPLGDVLSYVPLSTCRRGWRRVAQADLVVAERQARVERRTDLRDPVVRCSVPVMRDRGAVPQPLVGHDFVVSVKIGSTQVSVELAGFWSCA